MGWILFIVIAVIALLIGIWFLQRFYAKATLSSALVRTGLGGQLVTLHGGCLSLPIVHKIQRVNMSAVTVRVSRTGDAALLTADQLRADIEMEFEFQVLPTEQGVAAAAKALGTQIERGTDGIEDIITGPLIAAMQNAAASKTLASLHSNRAALTEEIHQDIESRAARLGLCLSSVSVLFIDQSDLSHFNERNSFDAQGMRHLAELISEQRRERIRIETEAEIAVRESALAKHQRQLEIERTEREATLANQEAIERLEAETSAKTEIAKSKASFESETARLNADKQLKEAQVAKDEELRRAEMSAILALEQVKIENDAQLTQLRTAQFETQAAEEAGRAQVALAAEQAQTQKEQAVAQRERETAKLRLQKELELNDLQARSQAEVLAINSKAEAEAALKLAEIELAKAESDAKARQALISAENTIDPAIIAMRLEERRLDRMPEIMTQMMKPVEKIDSIKINQIGGVGTTNGSENPTGIDSAFGSAMDQILSMAVRLPAMKQMGEEIGVDFDAHLAGRTADYANRIKDKDQTPPEK